MDEDAPAAQSGGGVEQQQQQQPHQQGVEGRARPQPKTVWPADAESRKGATIVIQPGSRTLRIGWAGDEVPKLVPHCLARRWKEGGGPRDVPRGGEEGGKDREKELGDVERIMRKWSAPTQKRGASEGRVGGGTGVEEEVADSLTADEVSLIEVEGGAESEESEGGKVYYGEDALRVTSAVRSDGSRYVLRRPVRRGRVDDGGMGMESVLCELQSLWEYAIQHVMGHDLKLLEDNMCVLVVPACACRTDIKTYLTVLITRMRMMGVCVMQDAVGAAYATV